MQGLGLRIYGLGSRISGFKANLGVIQYGVGLESVQIEREFTLRVYTSRMNCLQTYSQTVMVQILQDGAQGCEQGGDTGAGTNSRH